MAFPFILNLSIAYLFYTLWFASKVFNNYKPHILNQIIQILESIEKYYCQFQVESMTIAWLMHLICMNRFTFCRFESIVVVTRYKKKKLRKLKLQSIRDFFFPRAFSKKLCHFSVFHSFALLPHFFLSFGSMFIYLTYLPFNIA